ncbi:MAG: hydrolase [Clostridiales bacterium]|nr:hydrolase [Clostridiales bacterium]
MRILKDDTIALIIDIQEKLAPVIYQSEQIVHNTSILIRGLNALEVPMIVTHQYTKGLGMTVPQIREVFGDKFTYSDKSAFSCMDDDNIRKLIEDSGKKNVLLCGMEAHICVLQTAIDLKEKGYNVYLVQDCIGSRREYDMTVALQRAISEGIGLTTYESILFELTRVSGTETFKTISKLIK